MIKKNIANIITFIRIIGTFVMIFTNVLSTPFYVAYIVAGLSDVVDGFIARKLNITSEFGKRLDSIADLFFYTVMMIKIWPYLIKWLPTFTWVIIWGTLALRIVLYIVLGLKDKTMLSTHNFLNKLTGALMFFLPFIAEKELFAYYGTFVAIVALIAVVYEIILINKAK